jgi:hypothetical protein
MKSEFEESESAAIEILRMRRAFGDAACRNRLNLYGEHGHGGERYSENELLDARVDDIVTIRSNRTPTYGITVNQVIGFIVIFVAVYRHPTIEPVLFNDGSD